MDIKLGLSIRRKLVNRFINEFHPLADHDTSRTRMPFSLSELVPISLALRDACLGIIELAYPDTRPILAEQYRKVFKSIGLTDHRLSASDLDQQTQTWAHLFKVCLPISFV